MSARVVVKVTGLIEQVPVTWPVGWPIPREGDVVGVDGRHLHVRSVVWYPDGDVRSGALDEPFVYIVLAPPSPTWATGTGEQP